MSEDRPDFQTLLKGIRAGSQDAARQMLAIYGKHVLRVIRRRLHKRLRAKFDSGDFAQSVWASFFTAPASEGHFQRPEDMAWPPFLYRWRLLIFTGGAGFAQG
jgi:hypothetical protein